MMLQERRPTPACPASVRTRSSSSAARAAPARQRAPSSSCRWVPLSYHKRITHATGWTLTAQVCHSCHAKKTALMSQVTALVSELLLACHRYCIPPCRRYKAHVTGTALITRTALMSLVQHSWRRYRYSYYRDSSLSEVQDRCRRCRAHAISTSLMPKVRCCIIDRRTAWYISYVSIFIVIT